MKIWPVHYHCALTGDDAGEPPRIVAGVARTRLMTIPRNILIMVGIAALLAAIAFIVAGPPLATRTVRVVGYNGPGAEQIRQDITVIGRSGTALQPAGDIIREYADRLSTIRQVRIERDGLTGLVVHVRPRIALAVAHGRGAPVAIAADGSPTRAMGTRGLATLRWSPPQAMRQMLAFVQEIPPALRGRIRSLGVEDGALQGYLSSGVPLRLGRVGGGVRKGRALAAVFRHERNALEQARYVDLSVPERVILGPPRPSR